MIPAFSKEMVFELRPKGQERDSDVKVRITQVKPQRLHRLKSYGIRRQPTMGE